MPGLLNFRPVRNYGAAFGVFAGKQALLSALVLLLCAAVLFLSLIHIFSLSITLSPLRDLGDAPEAAYAAR